MADLKWCNYTYRTIDEYANGERHFLKVLITDNKFSLHVDDLKVEQPFWKVCRFDASKLFIGQVPEEFATKVRVRRSTTNGATIEAFKGVIQDLNLNNVFLVFNNDTTIKLRKNDKILKPLNYSNVILGQQTDDICKSKTPCQNNGTCENVFYNDFKCNCTRGFTGKDCSNIDYCLTVACEGGAKCKNAPDGYECIHEATFNVTSYVKFQAKTNHPDRKSVV